MTTQAELKQQIIDLYNNSDLKVNQIIRKLNITPSQFYKIRKQIQPQLNQRPKGKQRTTSTIKNFSYNHTTNNYEIRKRGVYYGSVKTHRQAERLVELLEMVGWRKELAGELKKQTIKEIPK